MPAVEFAEFAVLWIDMFAVLVLLTTTPPELPPMVSVLDMPPIVKAEFKGVIPDAVNVTTVNSVPLLMQESCRLDERVASVAVVHAVAIPAIGRLSVVLLSP